MTLRSEFLELRALLGLRSLPSVSDQRTNRTLNQATALYETSKCQNAIDEPNLTFKRPAIRRRRPRLNQPNQVFAIGKSLLVFLLPSVLAC